MLETTGGGTAIELWLAEVDRPGRQSELQREIWAELRQESMLEAGTVGVEVSGGVAVLRGAVRSYAQKEAASRAAGRVPGVQRIVNEIVVEPPPGERRSDLQLARMARRTLQWNALIPAGAVRLCVTNRWIRLEGEVDHEHQRVAAERAVEPLAGLSGLVNAIVVRPAPALPPADAVKEALDRALGSGARHLKVKVSGAVVGVRGHVRSLAVRHEVERVARAIAGGAVSLDELTIVR